ncbi:MAG: hypothetical protein ACK5KN_04230 [Dysgonomonas sp.]|jgi:hypothetical protein|uniref:hypothetical protein n=1 Tax=Dysgonomonas sp. TaxID=1891233 RepID=UPI003A8A13C9
MAYNRRNLLNKILEIQAIAEREYSRGVPYTYIFRTLIEKQYHISYSTFNNYLSCNAKREIELLDKKEAETKRQLIIEF